MLSQLHSSLAHISECTYPPVDQWDPPFCGPIPLHIDHAGQWWYDGSLIKRPALVRLFSRVLKREGERYFLVTPVEKVEITVDDVPLLIVTWQRLGDSSNAPIQCHSSTDDLVTISTEHPIEMRFNTHAGCDIPYIYMRNNLWAKVQQNVYYQFAEALDIIEGNAYLASGDYLAHFGTIE